MPRRVTLVSAVVGILMASGLVKGAGQPSFRSSTLAVRVDVLVTDGRKPVAGLAAEDFEIRDNGVMQSATLVDADEVALNVVLALDTSGSIATGTRHADLIGASEALLDGLKPADRAALATFSHAVVPRVALTGDLASVRQQLQRITASGRTAVMDGVYVALTNTLAQAGRSLVVVGTDGADISSWLRQDEVIQSALRSNAVIYVVTSTNARRASPLEAVVDATGGEMLRVGKTVDLREAFQKILKEFRSRYILAYTPAGVLPGGFHRLDVRVKRRGLTVRARPGYVGVQSKK